MMAARLKNPKKNEVPWYKKPAPPISDHIRMKAMMSAPVRFGTGLEGYPKGIHPEVFQQKEDNLNMVRALMHQKRVSEGKKEEAWYKKPPSKRMREIVELRKSYSAKFE